MTISIFIFVGLIIIVVVIIIIIIIRTSTTSSPMSVDVLADAKKVNKNAQSKLEYALANHQAKYQF